MSAKYMRSYRSIQKEVKELFEHNAMNVRVNSDIDDINADIINMQTPNESLLVDEELLNKSESSCEDVDSDHNSYLDLSSVDSNISDSDDGDLDLFQSTLASWGTRNHVNHGALNELLIILRDHGHNLPKDARTLKGTPRVIDVQDKCGGQYIYFGIKNRILKELGKNQHTSGLKTCKLMCNIDGVPLFKSSNKQFWPILCNFDKSEVFLVALFYGKSKPTPVSDYLNDFLEELKDLIENGVDFMNEHLGVELACFICDAPARSFVKGTKSHTGYSSCERCTESGSWEGRVVFNSNQLYPLRKEALFQQMAYSDAGHQLTRSPLIDYDMPCINIFPLDYMHLVCLGVVRRILHYFKKGPRTCKLSQRQISEISHNLISLSGTLPSEFARQPRSLYELDRWKATEFRHFLLYSGPIALHSVVNQEVYDHFLSLSVAMSILLCPDDVKRNHYLDYAKKLLQYFVQESKVIYGDTFVTYNVHGLIHLTEDVEHFQCSLNDISAFPFENHLQIIKKLVRNSTNPIVQVAKRICEFENVGSEICVRKKLFTVIRKIFRDSCFLLHSNDVIFIMDKRNDSTMYECKFLKFTQFREFFVSPVSSLQFGIAMIQKAALKDCPRKLVSSNEFKMKMVCLPYKDNYVVFPLLHTV